MLVCYAYLDEWMTYHFGLCTLVVTEGHLGAESADNSKVLDYDFSGTSSIFLFECMSDILCSGPPQSAPEAQWPRVRLGQLFKT